MRRSILLLSILAVCAIQVSSQPVKRPSFNGTWALQVQGYSEVYTFEHDAQRVHLIERIDDNLGHRVIDVEGPIDGAPHHFKLDSGDDYILTAQWFGDSLIYETRRSRSTGVFRNRRIMTMAGHDEIRALRTRFLPGPEQSWDEVWLRQAD